MTNIIFSLFASIIFSASALAQFNGVPYGSGVALSTSSSVISGSFAIAGGGVILRGIAQCTGNCDITDAHIENSPDTAYITIDNNKCNAKYKAPSWIVKDAIALVKSESSEVYRNVNLLGDPVKGEEKYSSYEYWHVEVSDALIKTKSGELLLAIDLMLTDPDFYSGFDINRDHDTVGEKADSNNATKEAIENNNIIDFYEVFEGLGKKSNVVNWTWNDERTKYSYTVSCSKKAIEITGSPTYTFLKPNKHGKLIEDIAATKYFTNNYQAIININQAVYDKGIQFARTSALLRNLKNKYPILWAKLVNESTSLPESHGSTPRIISR